MQIGDDYISGQEVTERITEIQEELELFVDEIDSSEKVDLEEELSLLTELIEDVDSPNDITFINGNVFQDYAEETAYDIGAISENMNWPACYIDWEAAADALAMDYSTAEVDGNTYYYQY